MIRPTTILSILFATSLSAQVETPRDREDTRSISQESKIEHDVEFDRAFDYWDSDDDGILETETYTTGVRERYDFDHDGKVSLKEWRNVHTPEADPEFTRTDGNSDGYIDSLEWSVRKDEIRRYRERISK
jgi:hypothetical protein